MNKASLRRQPFGFLALAVVAAWSAATPAQEPAPSGERGTNAAGQTASASSPAPARGEAAPGSDLRQLLFGRPADGSMGGEALLAGREAEQRARAGEALGLAGMGDEVSQARFDLFLSAAEVARAELERHQAALDRVRGLLRDNKMIEAWRGLYLAAEADRADGGAALELAGRIESIWSSAQAADRLTEANRLLREQAATAARNADVMSGTLKEEEIAYQKKLKRQESKSAELPDAGAPANNGGVPRVMEAPTAADAAPLLGSLAGKLRLTEEYLKTLESKARIKINELRQEKLLDTAKQDFSAYIQTLVEGRRYEHAVVGAEFYRKVFEEGEYPAEMARQVALAMEAGRRVESAVEVFRYHLGRGEVATAAARLREAFFLGEWSSPVLGLERGLKERVAGHLGRVRRMANMIEARDFGALEELLGEMRREASDFDTTKPMALVDAIKLESRLRMGKARLAAQGGDLKLAMEEFQAAAQAWPKNPQLEDSAAAFFDTQDVKSRSVVEFDRLVTENNHRGIFDKQLAFAPAIRGDAAREDALKKALEKVKAAEVALEKAQAMRALGDVCGAWESVDLAARDLPEDAKLNAMRAELAAKGAEFVSAIEKGKEAEARAELAWSLTWFANAQRHYPASRIANEAVERLSRKVLESQVKETPAKS